MANENNKPDFVVSDKRKFTSEGDLRDDARNEPEERASSASASPASPSEPTQQQPPAPDIPAPPTAEEQKAGSDAYAESRKAFSPSSLGERSPQDFEMNFERLVSSLYMSGAMALGGMQDEGGKTMVDIMGARQTIDTLAILSEKTKGNLTAAEENLLQSVLFDLRMAYVQVTNLIAKQAQQGGPEKPADKK